MVNNKDEHNKQSKFKKKSNVKDVDFLDPHGSKFTIDHKTPLQGIDEDKNKAKKSDDIIKKEFKKTDPLEYLQDEKHVEKHVENGEQTLHIDPAFTVKKQEYKKADNKNKIEDILISTDNQDNKNKNLFEKVADLSTSFDEKLENESKSPAKNKADNTKNIITKNENDEVLDSIKEIVEPNQNITCSSFFNDQHESDSNSGDKTNSPKAIQRTNIPSNNDHGNEFIDVNISSADRVDLTDNDEQKKEFHTHEFNENTQHIKKIKKFSNNILKTKNVIEDVGSNKKNKFLIILLITLCILVVLKLTLLFTLYNHIVN